MTREHEGQPSRLTLEEVISSAIDALLTRGSHGPTLIVEGDRRGIVLALADIADTHQGRLKQMTMVGMATARETGIGKLHQVFFISEAWMSMAYDESALPARPSEDPKRVEVLTIAQMHIADDNNRLVLLEMIRDASGNLIEVRQMDLGDEADAEVKSPLLSAFATGYGIGLSFLN